MVDAQQHQLHGDRRPLRARAHRRPFPKSSSRTSTRRAATPSSREERRALRLRHPRRPGGHDARRLAHQLLRMQGIEVGRATAEVKLKEGTYPAGSFVVKRDQPYGRLAKILLEKQDFPDPNLRTYDDTGWTMGLMSQAEVGDRRQGHPRRRGRAVDVPRGRRRRSTGRARRRCLRRADNGSNNMVTLRYRLEGRRGSRRARSRSRPRHVDLPGRHRSSFRTQRGSAWEAVAELGLDAVAAWLRAPKVAHARLDLPRLAIFSTWGSTQDVGWVRHAFDQFEVPYDLIYKERVRKGDLRADYDVILIPNQGRDGKAPGLRHRRGQAARLQEDRSSSSSSAMYGAVRRHHRRHGPRRRSGAPEVRRDGGLLSHPRRVELSSASSASRRASTRRTRRSSTLPARSSTPRSSSPTIPSSTATRPRPSPCATPTAPCSRFRPKTDKADVLMRFPGGEKVGAQRPHERRRRNQGPRGHRRRARRQGRSRPVRHQSLSSAGRTSASLTCW